MKLRAPEGCASICHEGRIFVIAADGTLDVNDEMVAVLAAHGFMPCDQALTHAAESPPSPDEKIDISALNRAGLFAFLKAHGIRASRRDTNEKLRAAARAALQARRNVKDL